MFPDPPSYKQDQNEILVYSIRTLLAMFKTPRYPNNHAAAYCFAILQDAQPRTLQIAQQSGLLQTVCALIEDCCKQLASLKQQHVGEQLAEPAYSECKARVKKFQSLATTYYIIVTGFLNSNAIRDLKEELLSDISRQHPHLHKLVAKATLVLDSAPPTLETPPPKEASTDAKPPPDEEDDDDDELEEAAQQTVEIANDAKTDPDVSMDATEAPSEPFHLKRRPSRRR